ncbi:hypothetical protein [Streptobacillus canis]|uniref:hypothetical protein n=1 Tax=Streptobacillus canis TaxID=2678686 RepID=UPI0012E188E5|nr:hypothetical protein [Streptobacillus canis]
MAKIIKFDLTLLGKRINNLELLQKNFSLSEIMDYYHSGILYKWLNIREYNDVANKVKNIKVKTEKEIAKELINIFEVSKDQKYIEEIIEMHYYEKKYESILLKERKDNQIMFNQINLYSDILNKAINEKEITSLMNYVEYIEKHFLHLFNIANEDFFNKIMINKNYILLLLVLASTKLKVEWLEDKEKYKKIKEIIGFEYKIKSNIQGIKEYNKNVNNLWEKVTNKKSIVIFIGKNVEIRENEKSEVYNKLEKDYKPLMLSKFEFKSNHILSKIIYLEVER